MQQEPNVDELLSRLVKVEAENRALKKQREKFGLTFRRYPEEGEAQFLLNGMVPYLTRIDSHCVVKEDPQNAEHLLIEGDNISALVALQSTHKGKVDVIYIDPPYNTGNKDFVYNDRYVSNDDGFRHSKWLSFMERRLYLAKELLSETGVIMLAIGNDEHAALRLLCESIFGADNFISNITWSGDIKNDARFVSNTSDYMLMFAKSRETLINNDVRFREKKTGVEEMLAAASDCWFQGVVQALNEVDTKGRGNAGDRYLEYLKDRTIGIYQWYTDIEEPDGTRRAKTPIEALSIIAESYGDSEAPRRAAEYATALFRAWLRSQPADGPVKSQKGNANYNSIDDQGRLFRADNISWPGGGGPTYDVIHPVTGLPVVVPSRGWRATPETMKRWISEGRVLFGKDHTVGVSYKRFLTDVMTIVPRDFFSVSRAESNRTLANIIGRGKFDFPKDHNVLARWIDAVTPEFRKNEDADPIVVLDFFAGSGTTGHAVAALNAEDGGNRQAILVTNNFEQDGSPNGIARDVTAARMKAVLTGQWADGKDHEALPGNLHYYKIDFKKPVANMISNAQTMQSRFAGLAALSTGAHVRVEADEVPTSAGELRDALDAEEAVLLRGKDNLVLVWQDYDLLLDEPERVQDILEEVDGLNAALETPLERIIYVPFDAEDTRDEFDFGSWTVVSFPVRYLREVANTVDMLVKSDLLLPLEATPADEEGDEGTTDIESDDPTASSGNLLASDD